MMAPLSNKAEETLWSAARSPSFRQGASWQKLCVYLEARDVDPEERAEEEWMKEFRKIQGRIVQIRNEAENSSPPRSSSESGDCNRFKFTPNWWERVGHFTVRRSQIFFEILILRNRTIAR
jgi:hypothetical protein